LLSIPLKLLGVRSTVGLSSSFLINIGHDIQICGLDLPQSRMYPLPKVLDSGLVCSLGTQISTDGATRNAFVASFDVFETVLLRPYLVPTDLHEAVWWLLGADSRFAPDALAWKAQRVQAESRARKLAGIAEVTLTDIYRSWPGPLSKADRDRAQLTEQGQELKVLRKLQLGVDLVQQARCSGSRVAFVSDMYLPPSIIDQALVAQGIRLPDDLLLVSSESGSSKRHGSLFEQLARKMQAPASSIFHVGDNQHSDIAVPKRLGMQAELVDFLQLNRYERSWLKADGVPSLWRSAVAGSSRAARLSRSRNDLRLARIADVSASVAAPLLTAFVLWTLQKAKDLGLGQLYYLARDGQILHRLATILAPHFGIDLKCHYLLASRQALLLPAFDENAEDAAELIAKLLRGRSMQDAAKTLGLEEAELAAAISADVAPSPRQLADPPDDDASALALKLMSHGDYRSHLIRRARQQSGAMVDYFGAQGLLNGQAVGIVDIGWRGNLQNYFARALKQALADDAPQVTGLYFGLLQSPPSTAGKSLVCSQQSHIFNEGLLEMFCAADHGTTTGYGVDDRGMPAGVLDHQQNQQALEWGLAEHQACILEFAQCLVSALPPRSAPLAHFGPALLAQASENLDMLIRTPTLEEAAVFGSFPHACDATHREYEQLAPVQPLRRAFAALGPYPDASRSLWPQATLMRSMDRTGMAPLASAFLHARRAVAQGCRRVAARVHR